jgi:RNA polymerase sigma-70 factor
MAVDGEVIERLFHQAGAEQWGLTPSSFAAAIEASIGRAFTDREPSSRELDRYVSALHLGDLALACACALGHEGAWEHFVREHRPVLYRTADRLDPTRGAREVADALYAELYGLPAAGGERRSLFRYFHGRSSLATWLRAVLAQRHVDLMRSRQRTAPLPDDDAVALAVGPAQPDPDRSRLVRLIRDALLAAIDGLSAKDRLRLRSYYLVELTLAQIGRITGEHEATVSRQLARTRRLVREEATRHLRETAQLDPAEIERGFELMLEDPEGLDLAQLFDSLDSKEPPLDRSI